MDKNMDRDELCSSIEGLKQAYEILMVKHDLPEFTELNKLFDIEDIDSETEFLLRKLRKIISERLANYLRFIEVVLNPSAAPMFFFKLIKKLESNDKETLSNLYERLGRVETELVILDLEYSEKKEADFIKKSFKMFNEELKEPLINITRKLINIDDNNPKQDNGSYFG